MFGRDGIEVMKGPVLWVDASCSDTTWQALRDANESLLKRLIWPVTWLSTSKHKGPALSKDFSVSVSQSPGQAAWYAQLYAGDSFAAWEAQHLQWPHLVAVIIETVDVADAQAEPEWLVDQQCIYWRVAKEQLTLAWSQALFFLMQSPTVRAHLREPISDRGIWRIQGPHDSSYSLALVNRSLALGLQELGVVSSIWDPRQTRARAWGVSTETVHDAWDLCERGLDRAHGGAIDEVVLYNDYPVNVWSLGGAAVRVLANYAWEESGYPQDWVEDINAQIDLVTAVTPLVKKILRNQGVRVPIAVVGNAVNHWEAVPTQTVDLSAAPGFRFLHVSSGLARKGVDVLLKAYGQAFRSHDAVTLIIKTVGNPDNQCARLLAEHQAADPYFPRVLLIDADWNDGQMKSLYSQVQVVVMPSRAEGFGLPAAEAIWQGVPVMATGFGGQVSLTSRASMALIDYDFTASGSHLGLPDSVWVEPRAEHLASLMKAWWKSPPELLQEMATQAQDNYVYPQSWLEVAQLTQQAVHQVQANGLPDLPEIAWVSTWNSPCGIATYSENLARAFPRERLQVFANTDAQALELDETYVTRCWMRGQERYPELAQAILAKGAKIAIVQSQPGLMSLSGLCDLLAALQAGQVATYVTLHNTRDWFAAEAPSLTGGQRHALSGATRLLVHTLEDMNRLKRAGFIDNVVYFPHGIYDSPKPEQMTAKSYWQIPEASPVIATFGFLMPHKGQQVLLEALAQLPPPYDQTHLLMLNTVLPEPGSQGEWQACQEKINALGLQARVHVETQFLVEAVALQHLAMADAIVFPYQYTKESASGAVRMGLATRRPVVVTPLAIFDDVAPVSYRLAGTDVTAITNGLLDLLGKYRGNGAIPEFLDQAHQMLAARDWVMLSKRLKNMVEGEYFDVFGPDLLSSITT